MCEPAACRRSSAARRHTGHSVTQRKARSSHANEHRIHRARRSRFCRPDAAAQVPPSKQGCLLAEIFGTHPSRPRSTTTATHLARTGEPDYRFYFQFNRQRHLLTPPDHPATGVTARAKSLVLWKIRKRAAKVALTCGAAAPRRQSVLIKRLISQGMPT
jgi:hypothetical protein